MGYIRSNEDWYRAQGCSELVARVRVELDRRRVDYGFCNPRKAEEAAEEEADLRQEVEDAIRRGE